MENSLKCHFIRISAVLSNLLRLNSVIEIAPQLFQPPPLRTAPSRTPTPKSDLSNLGLMQLIEHNIVSCLYKISIQHEYQEVTSSNIARFLSSRQMFFTLSLVLAVILYNSVSNLTLAEKDLLEHRLIDGKGDCFDQCTKLRSAKQKVNFQLST